MLLGMDMLHTLTEVCDASDWTHFTLYPRFVMPLIYQWSVTSLLCTACVDARFNQPCQAQAASLERCPKK